MLIGLSITYMKIQFVQKVDWRHKSYKQFLVKNETRAGRINFIFDFFLVGIFFGLHILQVSNLSIC